MGLIEASKRFGITRQWLSILKDTDQQPGRRLARKMAKIIGVPVDSLCGENKKEIIEKYLEKKDIVNIIGKKQLSKIIGLSVYQINIYIKNGMPHDKCGSRIRFDLHEVEDWLRDRSKFSSDIASDYCAAMKMKQDFREELSC